MNRKLISTIALAVIMSVPATMANASNKFNDVEGHWANKEIQEFVSQGYINGYPEDNTFRPNGKITRAEFISITNKYFGFTDKAPETFNDVSSRDWFYNDVCIAQNAGYIAGEGTGNFKPLATISREEVAKILVSIKGKTDSDYDKLSNFTDGNYTSDWAKPYMEGAIEAGYINGNSEGYLKPKENITRGESVVMISRVDNKVNIPPIITVFKEVLELKVGDDYNIAMLDDMFDVTDPDNEDFGESLELSIDDSKVNTTRPGKYEIIITATDTNFGTSTAKLYVVVKEKVQTRITDPNSSEFKAMVAKEVYYLVNKHRAEHGLSKLQ